jgi:hypothetical protein
MTLEPDERIVAMERLAESSVEDDGSGGDSMPPNSGGPMPTIPPDSGSLN